MHRTARIALAGALALALAPAAALARPLSIEVWTDRGNDAVYQPGDLLQIKARTSDDAHLLVYEIDAEGYVHLLHPSRTGTSAWIEGRRTYRIPDDSASDAELVVQEPVGQGYIVAIASREPYGPLPWYLRPYDPQVAGVGYHGQPEANEEEGVTAEGRIVGDPFVAMERIRRRVMPDPNDVDAFASAYATYYVHERVRYPRYLCYDCHRPSYWAWWDGFDPYYAHCSVFDFRVNWSWAWGPAYWCGTVPYFVYVVRYDCPPRYRSPGNIWYSAWDGWRHWCSIWGGPLVRYKSSPPAGYIPPHRYRTSDWHERGGPPGFISSRVTRGGGARVSLPIGHQREARDEERARGGTRVRRPDATRQPVREVRGEDERARVPGRRIERPIPRGPARDEDGRIERPRGETPRPRFERPRDDRREPPRIERPREERRNDPPPRVERPREERRDDPPPRVERPRDDGRRSPPPRGGDSRRGRGGD